MKKQSQFSPFIAQKPRSGEKTKPIQSQFLALAHLLFENFNMPVLLFGPAVVSVIRRLTLYHGRPTRLRPALPRKGICLLVAFVMLFGPENFHNLAQAQVEYADLNTATWAQGEQDIHYADDANGFLLLFGWEYT